MELHNTTLATAKRYGIYKEDIESFATEYGWDVVRWDHYQGSRKQYQERCDCLIVNNGEFDLDAEVQIQIGDCPICGERCVTFGWADGGYHHSTCSCEMIDYEGDS